MVILATNCPQSLDEAIQDRIDEMFFFEKPSLDQRVGILSYYIFKYTKDELKDSYIGNLKRIFGKGEKLKVNMSELDHNYLFSVSLQTEGFSARELNKLVTSWYDSAISKKSLSIDKNTANLILERHLLQNKTKDIWNGVDESDTDKFTHEVIY